jgi:hypothetical protein
MDIIDQFFDLMEWVVVVVMAVIPVMTIADTH